MRASLTSGYDPRKTALEAFTAYMVCQLQASQEFSKARAKVPGGPAITLSRQAGTGVHEIALEVAERMNEQEVGTRVPWTVFDRQLLEQVLEDHDLPKTLAEFMPEDRRPVVQDLMGELIGAIPPSWELVPKISATILRLARNGHAILVGRGANVITAGLPNVLRVRLIGSPGARMERLQRIRGISAEASENAIKKEDRARSRYVRTHFQVDIDDSLQYDLVINTDRTQGGEAAGLIVAAGRLRFQSLRAGG